MRSDCGTLLVVWMRVRVVVEVVAEEEEKKKEEAGCTSDCLVVL